MSKTTARNAFVRVNDGATATTLTNSLNSVTLTQNEEAPEVSVFGLQNRQRMHDGIKDWEMSIEGYYEGNTGLIDEVLFGLLASASCVVDFGPTGSNSGSVRYTASALLQTYEVNFQLEDAGMMSATFQARSGSMTRTTW